MRYVCARVVSGPEENGQYGVSLPSVPWALNSRAQEENSLTNGAAVPKEVTGYLPGRL